MPAQAILTAAARLAIAAARGGVAVGKTTVRAARAATLYSLRLAQRASTASQRMARAVWQRIRSSARYLVSKAKSGVASAWNRLIRLARRIRAALPQIVRKRITKTFEQLYDIYDLGSEALNKQRMTRRIIEQLRQSILDPDKFNRRMEDLARLFEDDEESTAALRYQALMLRYRQAVAQLAEDFDALMSLAETPDEEEQVRDLIQKRFFKEAAPILVAARIAETGDPTVAEDVDSQSLVYEAMIEFMVAVQDAYNGAKDVAEAIEELEIEVQQAISRASFRQMLAASAARIMSERNIDNFLFWHVAAPMSEDETTSEVERAREDIDALIGGRIAPSEFLTRAVRRARALTQAFRFADEYFISVAEKALRDSLARRLISIFDYSKISSAIKRVKDFFANLFGPRDNIPSPQTPSAEPAEYVEPEREQAPQDGDGGDEGVEEDEVYAIWELGDRRKHCYDCISLAELTSLFPVQVYQLPTPGTETQCGEYCGCSIEIVDRESFIEYSRLQWEMQPGRVSVAEVARRLLNRFAFNEDLYKRYIARIDANITPVDESLMEILKETAFSAPNVIGWEEAEF